MILGKIRPTVKNSAGKKTSLSNYRPVMNSSINVKIFKYLILPYLDKYLNSVHNQIAYRSSTGCVNVVILLKETISLYNQRHSDVFCAMIDHSQAYDRININTLCTKIKRTEIPEQVSNIIEYMCENNFINTIYGEQPSEFWPVGNEVLDTNMNLPVG